MKLAKSLRSNTAICFLALLAAGHVHRAAATPLQFGANYYEFVAPSNPYSGSNNSWITDNAAASAQVFNGVHGHLATITSAAENNFLFTLAAGDFVGAAGAWLGGKYPQGWLTGPETGQSFTYTNWGGIEPNNNGYAYMLIGTGSFQRISPGQWADDSNGGIPWGWDPVVGYFIEYEGAGMVPEPGTILLLGGGLASITFLRRRRYMTGKLI
jgi:hypothetical protein